MMRLLRRTAMLLALSLLTSAATADAECAWVLWSGKTNPMSAHETKGACEAFRRLHRALVAPTKGPDLECLPDTAITKTPSECNWMLWTYVPMPRPAKTVFATKQECEAARDDANRTIAKAGDSAFICGESTPKQRQASEWLLMRPGMVHSLIGTFKTYQQCQQRRATSEEHGVAFCLPDTVDPRGVKRK